MSGFEKLTITTDLPFSMVAEMVAWSMNCDLRKLPGGADIAEDCAEPRDEPVRAVTLSSRKHACVFELMQTCANSFELTVSNAGKTINTDEDLQHPIRAAIGMHQVGADVRAEGRLASEFPDKTFLDKVCPVADQISTIDQQIEPATSHLTLKDLAQIFELLIDEPRAITELLEDSEFQHAFPCVDRYNGVYGFPRHKSGNQVCVNWVDDRFCTSHSIDAPNPTDAVYDAFLKHTNSKFEIDEGYVRYKRKGWSLARTLGQIPDEHRADVFNWVSRVQFDVEDFHSTRGGVQIPEKFEYFFGNSVIFAGRDLNFELIEC